MSETVTAPPASPEDPRRELVRYAELPSGVTIAYDTFGDPGDPTLLLVMGLGMQMLGWDEDFCEQLVDRGFHVVRYDNRDVGLSTKIDGGGRPNIVAGALGVGREAPYLVSDMAADAVGLLDHLEVDAAHVVGASMGGMIAQTIAAQHPDRVLSLCSIMSSPGGRRVATMPRMSVIGTLLARPPKEREAYAEHVAKLFERIGSPGFDHDPERLRRRALLGYDRCFHPVGAARQLMAIVASGDRTDELRTITAPTLAIHGKADKLLPAAGGEAVAAAIPAARLELIEGMGHDLPEQLWPRIVALIAENAEPTQSPALARPLSRAARRTARSIFSRSAKPPRVARRARSARAAGRSSRRRVVAVEDPRIDVGGAADRRGVVEVAGRLLDGSLIARFLAAFEVGYLVVGGEEDRREHGRVPGPEVLRAEPVAGDLLDVGVDVLGDEVVPLPALLVDEQVLELRRLPALLQQLQRRHHRGVVDHPGGRACRSCPGSRTSPTPPSIVMCVFLIVVRP